MHQIRQLIGFLSKGYSISETVRLTRIARNTIRDYKRRIENQGPRLEDVVFMNNEALLAVVQDKTECPVLRKTELLRNVLGFSGQDIIATFCLAVDGAFASANHQANISIKKITVS